MYEVEGDRRERVRMRCAGKKISETTKGTGFQREYLSLIIQV